MFHGSGGWGALQLVGKYDVLEMGDTGNRNLRLVNQGRSTLNFVGACGMSPLFPGRQYRSTTAVDQQPTGPGRVAECGDMKTWVVGVNWWMTPYMRLMFNYAESDLSGLSDHARNDRNQLEPESRPKKRLRRRHGQRLRHARPS